MVFKKFINQNNFFILIWISFFFAININPEEFFKIKLISKLRILAPLILIIIYLSIYGFKLNARINKKLITYPFYFIFLSYIFFNLQNSENTNANIFWAIYMLLPYIFLHLFTNSMDNKKLLISTLILIFFIFNFFYSTILFKMFLEGVNHFYGILGGNLSYGNLQNPPRSSGMARMSLILFSSFAIFYILNENLKKKLEAILLLLIFFFGTTVLVFHSRTISFIYILINFIFFICYFKKYFIRKKLIIFGLILPILINAYYNFYLHKSNFGKNWLNSKNLFISSIIRDQLDWQRPLSLNQYSSGRFENWQKAIDKIHTKPFIGYGAQSDRVYLKQSVHNAILYSSLSGGIMSGIFIIIIYIYLLYKLVHFYFLNNSFYKNNFTKHISAIVLIILCLRSLLETSFAVFSIDYLLFILAFFIFNESNSKYTKSK